MRIFILQKKAVGSQLLEQVFYHLDIIEKDYFGLQFTDPYNVQHWLDPTKLVKKQVKSEYIFLVGMNVPLFLKWPHGEKKEKNARVFLTSEFLKRMRSLFWGAEETVCVTLLLN